MTGPSTAPLNHPFARILGCIVLGFAAFALCPALDLGVSAAFHDPATGFAIAGNPVTETIRRGIWNAAIGIFAVAAFGTFIGIAGRVFVLPARIWGLIVTLYILGPGVMVETLTKPLWGRARPGQIAEFGGNLPFSAPHHMIGLCEHNCSFVSGEVSGATVTALVLLILRAHLGQQIYNGVSIAVLVVAWCLPLIVALQRVASGGHFLSDTVFSVLFTLLLAAGLSWLLRAHFVPWQHGKSYDAAKPDQSVTAVHAQ